MLITTKQLGSSICQYRLVIQAGWLDSQGMLVPGTLSSADTTTQLGNTGMQPLYVLLISRQVRPTSPPDQFDPTLSTKHTRGTDLTQRPLRW